MGLAQQAETLDQAVCSAGHEAHLARDEEGYEFIAVLVRGPIPLVNSSAC
jgi:hypothetical protein